MRPGPSPEVIQRIEEMEGCPVCEALSRCYVVEELSYRNLCGRWDINTRTLMRLLGHCGIEPRRGTEAVRAQWRHAPEERRKRTAEMMRALSLRMVADGMPPRLGKTKATDAGARAAARKLKSSTSARRPEVRERNADSHRLFIRRNPVDYLNSKRSPTQAEAMMLQHLGEIGLRTVYNHLVMTDRGPKWVNIFIPALNLGVECEHYSRFPLSWERHSAISNLGIRLVYITNKRIGKKRFHGLDQYITHLKKLRPHPTAHGQNTMVWGRINCTVFDNQPEQLTVKRVSVDGGHTLLVTTTSNDPVLGAYAFDRSPP